MKFSQIAKQISIGFCLSSIIFLLAVQTASAQFTISLPKIPKIKKQNQEPPKQVDSQTTQDTAKTTTSDDQASKNRTSESKATTPAQTNAPPDWWLSTMLDDIKKLQQDVDEYTPEDKLYLVRQTQDDFLLMAVSKKERDKWGKDKKINDWRTSTPGNKFDAALDALGAGAAKKLPTYKANLADYKFHNPAEEKMMKGALTNIASYKIFSSGLSEASWLIEKNDIGIPTSRYKHGAVYLKDTTGDYPYCYLGYVNIIQDYSGGGTYGASYANFIRNELVGCPAGQ